jgi:Nitrile hydratase beta subunit, C-terminal
VTFEVGQRVRVSARSHSGHHRTPDYVKGKTGTIVARHGAFTNPETRAYGADGLPEQHVYLVALAGESNDRVYVDVFEHWLEPA